MNRKLIALIVGAGTLVLSACATHVEEEPMANCVFPDDGKTAAPSWVCGAPYPGPEIFAVGSYEKTAVGIDFQKTMAIASARDILASQFKVTVHGMVKKYAESTGHGDSETVDNVNTAVSKHITNETLAGSRMYTSRANPMTQSLYVLVGMDDNVAKKTAESALFSSMTNENALWQQFKAQRSFEELASEIANQ